MGIHRSGEDYLETILKLRMENGTVRSVDVGAELGYSKPSVSVAMKKLRESGHVFTDENGHLFLTRQGEAIAQRIYERHRVLTQMLMHLGVEQETAAAEACAMEHVISDDTFEKIKAHFMKNSH